MVPRAAHPDQLARLVRAAFSNRRSLAGVARVGEAAKQGVHRLTLDDGSTVILHVWDRCENHWPLPPGGDHDDTDPFSDATGVDLFAASHAALAQLGVRVPQVYFLDPQSTHYPAAVALVEDVRGASLRGALAAEPSGANRLLGRLGEVLTALHGARSDRYGKVAVVNRRHGRQLRSAVQVVRDRAHAHLAEAAPRVPEIGAARDRLAARVDELAGAVLPRTDFGLVYGALDTGHVAVDQSGEPILVDVEGLMYFDPEWEYALLRLRLGDLSRRLEPAELDPHRLALYRLAVHLALVAGPLREIDGVHPHRDFLRQVSAWNTDPPSLIRDDQPEDEVDQDLRAG